MNEYSRASRAQGTLPMQKTYTCHSCVATVRSCRVDQCGVTLQHFQGCYPEIRREYSKLLPMIGPVDPTLVWPCHAFSATAGSAALQSLLLYDMQHMCTSQGTCQATTRLMRHGKLKTSHDNFVFLQIIARSGRVLAIHWIESSGIATLPLDCHNVK